MALFKILKGDSSRVGTDTTPFHEGYAYFTPDDGGFYIDAVSGGSNKRIRINPNPIYATCSTASGTAAKVATTQNGDFALKTGASVRVKFTNANTASWASLNVNGTGAKSIRLYGSTSVNTYQWRAGAVVEFVYDGSYWMMLDAGIATDTYYGVTKLSSSVSSTSTALAATPSAVKQAYDLASQANAKATDISKSVNVTLAANGWSGNSQTVSVTGVTASSNGQVGIAQTATAAQVRAASDASLRITGQAAGTITIVADGEVPDIDIPLTVIIVK